MSDARDLSERTLLVTGANTGIGRCVALALARRGARLIVAGRSEERTLPVLEEIRRERPAADPVFVPLDLADLSSVRACAAAVLARGGPLHVLINNAGQAGARGLSREGFELAFAINHLGPFLLTSLLLERLRASAPARIVNVASRAHRRVQSFDWEVLRMPTRTRTGLREYSVSKLCNILFARALARRLAGSGVTTYAVHPGVVASDIWRRLPAPLWALMKLGLLSNEEGAAPVIRCAADPALAGESGRYYDRERVGLPTVLAEDDALAERLWSASAGWTGLA